MRERWQIQRIDRRRRAMTVSAIGGRGGGLPPPRVRQPLRLPRKRRECRILSDRSPTAIVRVQRACSRTTAEGRLPPKCSRVPRIAQLGRTTSTPAMGGSDSTAQTT
jgi:hypothetical protein